MQRKVDLWLETHHSGHLHGPRGPDALFFLGFGLGFKLGPAELTLTGRFLDVRHNGTLKEPRVAWIKDLRHGGCTGPKFRWYMYDEAYLQVSLDKC